MNASAGKRAAATKRVRYGTDGLSEIARKAYETRQRNRMVRLSELERHLARVAVGARNRARRRGQDCTNDLSGWAIATMHAQDHRCLLSGVQFDLTKHGHGAAPRPFAPSIDRIDSTVGYVPGNLRIVCWATNILLGTWGDDVAIQIANGIAQRASQIK